MQMKNVEILVGTFLLAGLVSLAILAIQVSGFSFGSDTHAYSVFARFDNVGGMVKHAKVSISGVVVGNVAEISLDQASSMALVRLEIDAGIDQISVDSTAAILTSGIIGGKFIGITIGAEEEYLVDGDEIEDTQSAIVIEDLVGQFLLKKF